jgi:ankyrin repeat protein
MTTELLIPGRVMPVSFETLVYSRMWNEAALLLSYIPKGKDLSYLIPSRPAPYPPSYINVFQRMCHHHPPLSFIQTLFGGGYIDTESRDGHGNSIWHIAAGILPLEIFQYLCTYEGKVLGNVLNEDGDTLIHAAAMNNNTSDNVKYLVNELGMDATQPNFNDQQPLYHACGYGIVDTIDFLLKCGSNINGIIPYSRISPLFEALDVGNESTINHLLTYPDLDVNIPPTAQNTTMIMAVSRNLNMTTIKRMIAKGADVNQRSREGRLPLHTAITSKAAFWYIILYVQNGARIHDRERDYGLEKDYNAIELARVNVEACEEDEEDVDLEGAKEVLRYIESAAEAWIVYVMMSAKVNPRLARDSTLRELSSDIIERLAKFLYVF